MSTLTVKLPQGQLRWWCLRLTPDNQGHIYQVSTDAPSFKEASEVTYTIPDGCEGELRGVVSTVLAQDYNIHRLYVLAYEKPSDADWEPLEFVNLQPDRLDRMRLLR